MIRATFLLAVLLDGAIPMLASAHEPSYAPLAYGAWVEPGQAYFDRPDYPPPGYVAYGAPWRVVPYPTPGPRVYAYPHGARVLYGPAVMQAYDAPWPVIPYPTPGPRVYAYPHGARVWYGPVVAPAYHPAYHHDHDRR